MWYVPDVFVLEVGDEEALHKQFCELHHVLEQLYCQKIIDFVGV
jgi:hypothetical protein